MGAAISESLSSKPVTMLSSLAESLRSQSISTQVEQMLQEFLQDMEWTPDAAVPRRTVLDRLGLADVARDLWADQEQPKA
jgi:hypothetical protein